MNIIDRILASEPAASIRRTTHRVEDVLHRVGEITHFTRNPRMASPPNSMHDDCYSCDVSGTGPIADEIEVRYLKHPNPFGGICPCFGLADDGDLLTISFSRTTTTALRLCHQTLRPKAARALPPRTIPLLRAMFNRDALFQSTEGGTYYFVDEHHRMVIPTLDRSITILGQTTPTAFDVKLEVATDTGSNDKVVATQPLWSEREPGGLTEPAPDGYWFATDGGCIGVARPHGEPQVPQLALRAFSPNEKIQNSFATNVNGAFVVTTHGLYRLQVDGNRIAIVWKESYPRDGTKYGKITEGSGTTPTLIGTDYVTIGDGSTPMQVMLFHQAHQGEGRSQLADAKVVFADQPGSECEDSMIVAGNRIVVCNTYGYINPFRMDKFVRAPGLECFKVEDGKLVLEWCRKDVDIMSALPKVSTRNDVMYLYTMDWTREPRVRHFGLTRRKGRWRWKVLGIDLHTGDTVYEVPLFEGRENREDDNGWGTICLANDAMYIGMWRGAVRVGRPA